MERGLFDPELVPEELTQQRMGKIIKDKYSRAERRGQGGGQAACHRCAEPHPEGQGRRRSAIGERGEGGNTALIDGVRKFAMDVRELDIDLIDRINPFSEAYAILAKTMSEDSLKQIAQHLRQAHRSFARRSARACRPARCDSRRRGPVHHLRQH